ncbi:hypothetical protein OnM2_086065 [Erysiphe neolycopersici]|uniref:Uncharacterized protein n=1 Tax=Erysiphe neolycopersici TaxID=212602 RepID=A0A420HEL6_9PEZI|nr:hypothetical protein OnM2_086065 [Erysiphe neolycopersici]
MAVIMPNRDNYPTTRYFVAADIAYTTATNYFFIVSCLLNQFQRG